VPEKLLFPFIVSFLVQPHVRPRCGWDLGFDMAFKSLWPSARLKNGGDTISCAIELVELVAKSAMERTVQVRVGGWKAVAPVFRIIRDALVEQFFWGLGDRIIEPITIAVVARRQGDFKWIAAW